MTFNFCINVSADFKRKFHDYFWDHEVTKGILNVFKHIF